jgi:hypothetical protein
MALPANAQRPSSAVGWSALLGGGELAADVCDSWIIEHTPPKVKNLPITVLREMAKLADDLNGDESAIRNRKCWRVDNRRQYIKGAR